MEWCQKHSYILGLETLGDGIIMIIIKVFVKRKTLVHRDYFKRERAHTPAIGSETVGHEATRDNGLGMVSEKIGYELVHKQWAMGGCQKNWAMDWCTNNGLWEGVRKTKQNKNRAVVWC